MKKILVLTLAVNFLAGCGKFSDLAQDESILNLKTNNISNVDEKICTMLSHAKKWPLTFPEEFLDKFIRASEKDLNRCINYLVPRQNKNPFEKIALILARHLVDAPKNLKDPRYPLVEKDALPVLNDSLAPVNQFPDHWRSMNSFFKSVNYFVGFRGRRDPNQPIVDKIAVVRSSYLRKLLINAFGEAGLYIDGKILK